LEKMSTRGISPEWQLKKNSVTSSEKYLMNSIVSVDETLPVF
jgi:hypothetical protein